MATEKPGKPESAFAKTSAKASVAEASAAKTSAAKSPVGGKASGADNGTAEVAQPQQHPPSLGQPDGDSFKRSISVCARAMGEDHSLNVEFVEGEFNFDAKNSKLADVPQTPTATDIAVTRGHSDSVALFHNLHDSKVHRKHQPKSFAAQNIFAMAEQLRCEAHGSQNLPGVQQNLDASMQKHYAKLLATRGASRETMPMEEAIALKLREKIMQRPLPPAAQKIIEPWSDWLDEMVAPQMRDDKYVLDDQADFAKGIHKLLQRIRIEDAEADPDYTDEDQEQEEEEEADEPESAGSDDSETQEGSEEQQEAADDQNNAEEADTEDTADESMDSQSEEPGSTWRPLPGAKQPSDLQEYQVFTREFDEVVKPQDLCSMEELSLLRGTLDQHVGDLQKSVGRFANRLQRSLLAQQNRSWDFDLEEGQLDSSRLTRVLTDPMQPLSFKQEQDTEFRDTVVTLLLDNSGSMHGRSIRVAAVCADILSSTLERCGVRVEILGFTTCAWKGGQSREKWVKSGYPENPGRLNDLRHIVYKSADMPWRRARRNMGLMMRKGLLKENIDGEALLWAHGRLRARPEQRKILMMISDGAPIDDSTLSTNPGRFLERHLRAVIDMVENQSPVELVAVGIGHDVGQYYDRAATIVDVGQLASAMTEQLADLFAQPAGRSGSSRRSRPMRRAG